MSRDTSRGLEFRARSRDTLEQAGLERGGTMVSLIREKKLPALDHDVPWTFRSSARRENRIFLF
jgi:hypothetical protein